MQISWAEHIRLSKQQVQRPWGRNMIYMLEEKQRPVCLEWSEWWEPRGAQVLYRLRIMVGTLDFTLSELRAIEGFE